MKVRDAMATQVVSVTPNSSVGEVAAKMKSEGVGFIPVVESDNKLVGVVTDRDIVVRCLAERHGNCIEEAVDHIMTSNVESIAPDAELSAAADKMRDDEIRRLVVVEDGRLVGVLSHGHLVQALKGSGPAMEATEGVTRGA
jgi:CBS domain-containing protein